ncbi:MAG: hypothetical protein ACOCQG_00540 [Candidatus Nanoarchaeia archaeon]
MKDKLKDAFSKIKEELNDHRETLNQNTNEIQSNYELLCRLESKLDKLEERVDEISLFVQQKKPDDSSEQFSVSTLTRKEQEVFMAIYTNEEGVTYYQIGRKTGLTEDLVVCYVTNLIAKGVPLVKRYVATGVLVYLDEEFKRLQAHQNILKISESVGQKVS